MFKNTFKILILSVAAFVTAQIVYAQTASILPPAKTTFFDSNGKPLANGKVDFYIPGTTTRKMTWQDAGETIPNTNPVVLDTAGRAIILGDGSYRQRVTDKNGNLIWDQVTSSTGSGGGGGSATVGDGDAVGTVKAWAGLVAPSQYVFAYGQEFVRASYPELFSAITSQQNISCTSGSPTLTGLSDTSQLSIGTPIETSCLNSGSTIVSKTTSTVVASSNAIISTTTTIRFFPFGNGDGINTFTLPDLRGRAVAGRDNMGGIAANRLSLNGLGSSGGSQSQTLTLPNLPSASLAVDIPSGQGGHLHTYQQMTQAATGGAGFASQSAPNGFGLTQTSNTTSSTLPAMTGTAILNGSSTPISIIQPTQIQNYIIKVLPDTNPNSYFGVASIGGMYGVIECGFGITCAGNTISAINSVLNPPTPTVLGGIFSSDAPANEFAIGIDTAGNVLYGGGSTTVNGQVCTIGGSCTITASAGSITVGSTTVIGGTINGLIYKDSGGLIATSNSGNNGVFITNGGGVPSLATSNVINNNLLTQMNAATIKGNPSSSTANTSDFTIQGLSSLSSPNSTLDYLLIYDHVAGTLKSITPQNLIGTSGVTAIGGMTGSIACGGVITCTSSTISISNGTAGYALIGNGVSTPTYQGFLQTGTGAINRTWQDKAADFLNAKDFGTICDGITDTHAAIQSAIDAAIPTGLQVLLPSGVCYLGTTGITVTNIGAGDTGGNNPVLYRTGLWGKGAGATILLINGNNAAITVQTGGDIFGTPNLIPSTTQFGNFSISQSSSTKQGIGFAISQTARISLTNISISGFSNGISITDAYSLKFYNIVSHDNITGLGAFFSAYSHPNDMLFTGCHFIKNTTYGVNVENPTTLHFEGGSFEKNGSGNIGEFGDAAIHISGNPIDGAAGLTVHSVYFEGNYGQADILLDLGGSAIGIHNIEDSTFNRIDSSTYVVNNISMYNGTAKTIVRIVGNGFEGFNTYVPNGSRLYWTKSDPNSVGSFSVTAGSNLCASSTETPSGC